MAFKFEMSQYARIIISGEVGIVIGRSEHSNAEPQYLLRYERKDGAATEAWWTEAALSTEVTPAA